jgi:ATP adenylyltransferase
MSYLEEEPPDGCIFCLKPQEPDESVHILHRDAHCYVILNRYPYNDGHLMIVPYAHVATLEQLPPQAANEMMALTQESLRILRVAYQPNGFNLGMNIGGAAGAGVAEHIHMHVVPRWHGDTNYMTVTAQTRIIPEWMDQTYARLRPLFELMGRQSPA